MKKIVLIISILSVMTLNAFDGFREGFILGVGAGFSSQDNSYKYQGSQFASDQFSGFATSFKLGYGFNEHFTLYYARYANWYDALAYNGSYVETVKVISGISAIGGTYFFNEKDSFFITGAIGVADFGTLESTYATDYGTGGLISIGYEWENGFALEGVLRLNTEIEATGYPSLTTDTTSSQFLFSYNWY